MSPVAFLVLFCATMTAVAVNRIDWTASDELGEPEGTAGIVLGFTILAVRWFGLQEGWLSSLWLSLALALLGAVTVVLGLVVLAGDSNADDPQDANALEK
ncbi:hypothetical protein [Natronosalvus halobius]|uniref:hypothetical protein n=1 Tax=Natronosalvus halobius TaxID=2953746 RepID=UPI0020A0688B|nr:hypothetical protein [Natronosalvus halobius]USZ71164.1 hypothetical protein NGM15_13895 [Natronosalvus halobius]